VPPHLLFWGQVLAEGSMTVDEIHEVSKIDHWFLRRLERIADFGKDLEVRTFDGFLCNFSP
ncbi:unnamed protein product, partial [Discosporangium mesarthrocarpum]